MKKLLLSILSIFAVGSTMQAAELHAIFTADFTKNQQEWTIDDKVLPEGLTYVWKQDSQYGMKATAYVGGKCNAAESWLLSPVVDLSQLTNLKVAVNQAANKFGNDVTFDNYCQAYVIVGGQATRLTFTNKPKCTDWTYVADTIDVSAFCGKKDVQFGFKYISTDAVAPTWEIKSASILTTDDVQGNNDDKTEHCISIHAMKQLDISKSPEVDFEFTNLLVTCVNKRNVFLQENLNGEINGLLCYLNSDETVLKAGDIISGKVSGTLKLYNETVTEFVLASLPATVVSSDNAIEAQTATIADITNNYKDYESELVIIKNVQFKTAEWASSNITIYDDSDNEVVVRDNFKVASSMAFDTEKSYNVTALVSSYKGAIQIYPRAEEDIQLITNKQDAGLAFAQSEIAIKGLTTAVNNALTKATDGAITWTSSNEKVATVAADGSVTVLRYGFTTIKAEAAETNTYVADAESYTLYVLTNGDGTAANPYAVTDVKYYSDRVEGKQYVKGYIVGTYIDKSNVNFSNDTVKTAAQQVIDTNLAIADDASETDLDFIVPVQLPVAMRDALSLKRVPERLGEEITVEGDLTAYFSQPGVRNVTSNSSNLGAVRDDALDLKSATVYNILGQKVPYNGIKRPGVYLVNGKKVFLK